MWTSRSVFLNSRDSREIFVTELFQYLGIRTEGEVLLFLNRVPQLSEYPLHSPEITGYYHSTEYEEGEGSIYVFIKGRRTSFHFKDGKLDHILAPTNSMVYL